MINVTKTYLPKKAKYLKYVDRIFSSGWITNNGPMVKLLEKRLEKYLNVKNLILVSNGTLALEIAYRALHLKGEVITSPFSFVATTSSIFSNGLKPIFADIDSDTLNINHSNIESKISNNTSAIVPVHVFGNACKIEEIDEIAKKHDLKVIYDAAHAFNVKFKNKSILLNGDISILSFHATKIFHTIEGGALIVNDESLVEKIRYLINFGIKNSEEIPELGTNAKMNEFSAAMGLCILDDIDLLNEKRKLISELYTQKLSKKIIFPIQNEDSSPNHSYFPIILNNYEQLKLIEKTLNSTNIFPRRYFYPSLDTLDYINEKQFCKISRDISSRILCLPMYPQIDMKTVEQICDIVNRCLC